MRKLKLDAILNMDERPETTQDMVGDNVPVPIAAKREPVEVRKKEKPSILEALKQGTEKSRSMFGEKSGPEKVKKLEVTV